MHLFRCQDASGIPQSRSDIIEGEVVIAGDLLYRHPAGEPPDDQLHRHTGALNDRFTKAHSGING